MTPEHLDDFLRSLAEARPDCTLINRGWDGEGLTVTFIPRSEFGPILSRQACESAAVQAQAFAAVMEDPTARLEMEHLAAELGVDLR